MTSTDLAIVLTNHYDLTIKVADEIVRTFFEAIVGDLIEGDRPEFRGFGSFSVREYGSYTGRNPRTGEPINVKPKRSPFFKPGREMIRRLNREQEVS